MINEASGVRQKLFDIIFLITDIAFLAIKSIAVFISFSGPEAGIAHEFGRNVIVFMRKDQFTVLDVFIKQ